MNHFHIVSTSLLTIWGKNPSENELILDFVDDDDDYLDYTNVMLYSSCHDEEFSDDEDDIY